MESKIRWFAMHWMMAGVLAVATPLAAVELSSSGEGDALIFPIWATTNGHLSVFSVVDSQWLYGFSELPAQAVKVLVRDAQGQLLFGANLYLRRSEDAWSASITSLPDGRSRLASSDGSCVLVGEPGAVTPWSGSADLDADHGFIEFIVMATIRNAPGDGSCEGLATRWNSGPWAQDPGADLNETDHGAALRGSLNLVNVQKGTSYTIPASALREFSDISQHTAPSSVLPDLALAHDSGTAENATRSRVCDVRHCQEDTWASPRDAVAAALMASALRGDYANSPSLAGKSDLVFSYPMRHHYTQSVAPHLSSALVFLNTFDREGQFVGGYRPPCPDPYPPQGCEHHWEQLHTASVKVVGFSNVSYSGVVQSAVLGIGIEGTGTFEHAAPAEGQFRANFQQRLTSNSGRIYGGMPVIGVVLQQFENGNLTSEDGVQQRANYGVAVPMTRTVP